MPDPILIQLGIEPVPDWVVVIPDQWFVELTQYAPIQRR